MIDEKSKMYLKLQKRQAKKTQLSLAIRHYSSQASHSQPILLHHCSFFFLSVYSSDSLILIFSWPFVTLPSLTVTSHLIL